MIKMQDEREQESGYLVCTSTVLLTPILGVLCLGTALPHNPTSTSNAALLSTTTTT